MRIQIAELPPPITVGVITEHPFVVIIDTLTPEQLDLLTEQDAATHMRKALGARAVMVFTEPIDITATLDLTSEQQAHLQALIDTTPTDRAGDPLPPTPSVPPGNCTLCWVRVWGSWDFPPRCRSESIEWKRPERVLDALAGPDRTPW